LQVGVRRRSNGSRWNIGAIVVAALVGIGLPAGAAARDLYVAPTGSPANDGSASRPLDLATAISSATPARPGDIIWMRGGVYAGPFTSSLSGTAAQPITLRQYPGERATVDGGASPATGTFVVLGQYATYWGFEITNSGPQRLGGIAIRGTGLDIYGPHTKFINLVVHDAQTGVGFWTPAVDSELYGLVIYNNGIDDASDRGHGHSIYTQNDTGIKRIADNIALNSFSFGIHAYTQGGRINNFVFTGNVLFNHGIPSAVSGAKSNLLLGGGQVSQNAAILDNFSYYGAGSGGRGGDIGYGVACNAATLQRNMWVADTALNFNCTNTTFTGNTLYGGGASSLSGAYPANTYLTTRPAAPQVFVRPNQYEAGRANIIVYNWPRQSQVNVDLSPVGFALGDEFEIHDAQDFFGAPILTGVYGGVPVNLSMLGLNTAVPVGNAPIHPPHTDREFGAFVVMRRSSSSIAAPSAVLTASPQSIISGQTATLSWSTSNAATVTVAPSVGSVAASGSVVVTPATTTTYTLTAANSTGTTSATATVTVSSPSTSGTTATFLRTDLSTQGSWKGVYGADGYALANDRTSYPAYARATFGQQQSWTWSGSNTDPRALQKGASSTDRLAACWFSTGTFSIDVDLVDGLAHEIALYSLDWDSQARVQTVELADATTAAVLDRQTISGFSAGRYAIWRVSGHVVIRITRTGPNSSAVSGIFFGSTSAGSPPSNIAPAVTMTSPTAGQSFAAPAAISLAASASDSDGTVTRVEFYVGANLLGTGAWNGTAYTFNWLNVPAGSYQVTAKATDNSNASTTSSPVTAVVASPPTSATAVFLTADATTQGQWRGVYGADGYVLANASASYPSYAQVAIVNSLAWTWAPSTTLSPALQKATGLDRIAACWYSSSVFSIDVNLVDGASHQVAIYALDWDSVGRSQVIDILDAATGAVLDSRAVSGFAGGQYQVWRLSGHVTIRATRTGPANATLSGLFFDSATSGPPTPTVTLAAPADGAVFTAPASITLSATASEIGGTVSTVSFYAGTTLLGTSASTSSPYSLVWPNVAVGTYVLTAKVVDAAGTSVVSTPIAITVRGSADPNLPSATFVRADATTQGNWKGIYGAAGYALANDRSVVPSFAQVAIVNSLAWTWTSSTNAMSAPQVALGSGRMAACWYSASVFSIDVNLVDNAPHQVAIYALDWDQLGRGEVVDILDATTGAVLESRTVSSFAGGQYYVWRLSGHVTIRVTRTGPANATISGLFFDPAP
jgi:hypothetical protein